MFARKGDDWITELLSGDDALLRMPEIGIEIPLSELYAELDLTAMQDGSATQDSDT